MAGSPVEQLQAFLWQLAGVSFPQGWEVLDPRPGTAAGSCPSITPLMQYAANWALAEKNSPDPT
jgi:hypothetical protein